MLHWLVIAFVMFTNGEAQFIQGPVMTDPVKCEEEAKAMDEALLDHAQQGLIKQFAVQCIQLVEGEAA